MLKKRTGSHEESIREYSIDGRGIRLAKHFPVLPRLNGTPIFNGSASELLAGRESM